MRAALIAFAVIFVVAGCGDDALFIGSPQKASTLIPAPLPAPNVPASQIAVGQ
jgi:hypothetical protein